MSSEVYNFRKPSPLDHDAERRLRLWLEDAAPAAAARAAKLMACPFQLKMHDVQVVRPPECLERLPAGALARKVETGTSEGTTLLVVPRTLALLLVAGSLGDTNPTLPAEREPTSIEESIFEYLLQQLLVPALQEAWAGNSSLNLTLGASELQPRRTRQFAPGQSLICCEVAIRCGSGEENCIWLMPLTEWTDLIAPTGGKPELRLVDIKERNQQIEAIVNDLPVGLSVELGTTQIPLTQVANLKPGDVVLLDQRVSEPLMARVAGQEKFRVWPGRVGSRQAVRIESIPEA